MYRPVMTAAALLLGVSLALVATAGEGLDRIRDCVSLRRTLLAEQALTQEKARSRAAAADTELADALDLLDAGDEDSVRLAFKHIGKGMKRMGQAAKAEGSPEFEDFARASQDELWDACISMFVPGSAVVPEYPPEQIPLYKKLGRRLKGALKKARRGRLAKAVRKLARAYPSLLAINADP